MRFIHYLAGGLLLVVMTTQVVTAKELPEQLSFDAAMKLVDEGQYPSLVLAKAGLEQAQAEQLGASGLDDMSIDMNVVAQFIDSSVDTVTETDDHRISLILKKTLYDAGYSDDRQLAAETDLQAARLVLDQVRLEKRLEVARKFFDIKLADLQFSYDNEAIATAYVKFNKLEERNKLKMASDVDMLAAKFEYEKVRSRRYQSEVNQRISRARFAESVSRPEDLPSEVVVPDLSYVDRKRPDYEELLKQAMSNNFGIRLQHLRVQAAQKNLEASRNKGGSTLSTELEWAEYTFEAPNKSNWRAALKYSIPLYETDSVKSERARAQSRLYTEQARLSQLEAEVRQQLLEAWQSIYVLKAKQQKDAVEEEYRELYQDRSRGYYEMEFRTDLGDSFVRVSEARLEKNKNLFELAVAWIRLAMLTGNTLEEFLKQ